ncbi:MAG TPA: tetratricopeptide repeat protein [Candidatus Eisenbacteria bacterium]
MRGSRATTRRSAARLLPAAVIAAIALGGCSGSGGPTTRPAGPSDGDPLALVALADSAVASGDAATARRALDRAFALRPDDPAVRLGRGRFFAAIRRYHDAKQEFDRAAALEPASPEPAYQLGLAYVQAGDTTLAIGAFGRALAIDPGHAGARTSMEPLLAGRYVAAGVPGEYAQIPGQTTVSRGELGVILAVELGADPDRSVWRSDDPATADGPEIDQAWGARWLRAAVTRRWLEPYPDRSLHLDDPVTRGNLALLLARLSHEMGADSLLSGPGVDFPDLAPRHYLERPATWAVRVGLPTRAEGRFDARAGVTGLEALVAVRGLARAVHATPVVSPAGAPVAP